MPSRGAPKAHEGPISTDDGEIEVTPEMVREGVRVFGEHRPMPIIDRLEIALADVYRAMHRTRP